MVFPLTLILPLLIVASSAQPFYDASGQPRLGVSFPSQLGAVGAAAFGQRYNAATDADRVTLNFGLKKTSDLTAGGQMGNAAAQGGGGMGMYGPPNPAMAGAGYGQGMYQPVSGHAGMHDSLGLDFGVTREKGVKAQQGQQQQGVMIGFGGYQG